MTAKNSRKTVAAKQARPRGAKAAPSAAKRTPLPPPPPPPAPAAAPAPVPPAPPLVTPEQRQRMVESAAYYLAEKNGFSGDPQQYWLQAEKEVDATLGLLK